MSGGQNTTLFGIEQPTHPPASTAHESNNHRNSKDTAGSIAVNTEIENDNGINVNDHSVQFLEEEDEGNDAVVEEVAVEAEKLIGGFAVGRTRSRSRSSRYYSEAVVPRTRGSSRSFSAHAQQEDKDGNVEQKEVPPELVVAEDQEVGFRRDGMMCAWTGGTDEIPPLPNRGSMVRSLCRQALKFFHVLSCEGGGVRRVVVPCGLQSTSDVVRGASPPRRGIRCSRGWPEAFLLVATGGARWLLPPLPPKGVKEAAPTSTGEGRL